MHVTNCNFQLVGCGPLLAGATVDPPFRHGHNGRDQTALSGGDGVTGPAHPHGVAARKGTAMAPSALPQPPDRQPDGRPHGRRAAGARPALVPAPEPAHSTRPPGGERPGRLPGPQGPDRLASGAVPPTAPLAPVLPLPVPPGRSHTVELPATPAAVRAARGTVDEVLASWGVADGLIDSVVLVTSELVTNAVTHSGSERIVCRLYKTAGLVRVEVEDQNRGRRLPAPRRPGPEEQSGRGLLLVGTLSRDWGAAPAPHGGPGRVVWAELVPAADDESAIATGAGTRTRTATGAGPRTDTGTRTNTGPLADPGTAHLPDPSRSRTRPEPPTPKMP